MILQFHVWVFIEGNKNTNYNIYWKDVWTPICTAAWFIIFIILRYRNNVNAHKWMKTTLSLFPYMCVCLCIHVCALPRLTLYDPMDCSPPGSSVHGILQARILEWVAISSSRGSFWPRDWTHVSCVSCDGRWLLYHWATWKTTHTHTYTHTPENNSSIKNEISPCATRRMNFLLF